MVKDKRTLTAELVRCIYYVNQDKPSSGLYVRRDGRIELEIPFGVFVMHEMDNGNLVDSDGDIWVRV